MPRARLTFSMDGLAAMFGAVVGTSTTTAYVESASGIEEGGRTGLTATMVGALFGLSMFLWPLAGAVPGAATAPALILVGALMMEGVRTCGVGRHRRGRAGLPHHHLDAADLLDRQRRQLRRDQLLRDRAAQRSGAGR